MSVEQRSVGTRGTLIAILDVDGQVRPQVVSNHGRKLGDIRVSRARTLRQAKPRGGPEHVGEGDHVLQRHTGQAVLSLIDRGRAGSPAARRVPAVVVIDVDSQPSGEAQERRASEFLDEVRVERIFRISAPEKIYGGYADVVDWVHDVGLQYSHSDSNCTRYVNNQNFRAAPLDDSSIVLKGDISLTFICTNVQTRSDRIPPLSDVCHS